jgi:hypothetical protein
VTRDSYKYILFEEITMHFFGVELGVSRRATNEEMETFLFLIDTEPAYAVDFLRSWLELKGLMHLTKDDLNIVEEYVKIKASE